MWHVTTLHQSRARISAEKRGFPHLSCIEIYINRRQIIQKYINKDMAICEQVQDVH